MATALIEPATVSNAPSLDRPSVAVSAPPEAVSLTPPSTTAGPAPPAPLAIDAVRAGQILHSLSYNAGVFLAPLGPSDASLFSLARQEAALSLMESRGGQPEIRAALDHFLSWLSPILANPSLCSRSRPGGCAATGSPLHCQSRLQGRRYSCQGSVRRHLRSRRSARRGLRCLCSPSLSTRHPSAGDGRGA